MNELDLNKSLSYWFVLNIVLNINTLIINKFNVVEKFKKILNRFKISLIYRLISNKIIILFSIQKDIKILTLKNSTTLKVKYNVLVMFINKNNELIILRK